MLQRGWQHLWLHHLKRGVELFKQFGIMDTLRVCQFDGQGLHADGLVGKHGVEAKIKEIGTDAVAFKGCSVQEVHDEAAFGGTLGVHGFFDECVLAFR